MSSVRLGKYAQTLMPFSRPVEALTSTGYVIGSPGMGKSTLLGNLCEQYCANGDGVLLLDIKGDLARDVASRTRFPERTVYVKPGSLPFSDGDRVWTLNPFEGHRGHPEAGPQIATNVLESFERMGRADFGIMANIKQTLMHAIRLAMTTPEPTLLDLLLIVVDQPYRQEIVTSARSLNHISRRFWSDLDDHKMPARERRGQINTTRNRLESLLLDRELNLFVGNYHSTLRLKEWLDEGKMILIDLGSPLPRGLGIDIGNVIMAQLVTDTFLRTDADKARTWRFVVDEFHEFVGDNFSTIITEARSFNVFPVLAHQDRSQLDKAAGRSLRSAVGHAGLTCLLPTSPEDRVAYASLYGRDQADLILGLERYRAMVTLMNGLTGRRQSEMLVLDDWWRDAVPGQLDELQLAAYENTIPRKEIVQRNNQRYWDRLDAVGRRLGGVSHESPQPKRSAPRRSPTSNPKTPSGTSPLQPGPRQDPAVRNDPEGERDATRPQSPALLDSETDFEVVLPGGGGDDC